MKKALRDILVLIVIFAIAFAVFNYAYASVIECADKSRMVTVNRIADEVASSSSYETCIEENLSRWQGTFDPAPASVEFIGRTEGERIFVSDGTDTVVRIYRGGELQGFISVGFKEATIGRMRTVVNIAIGVFFCLTVALALYIRIAILEPFNRLSDYPERIAKIPDAKLLTETKSRRFGKYIWSMNMLRDVLGQERRKTEQMECERQKLIATVAHSVKTPVMNIKLYTEALSNGNGLADQDGRIVEATVSDIASKIDSNADRILNIAKEVIDASTASVSYEPEIEAFYLADFASLIREEYTQRLELARIPFEVECDGNPLVKSDRFGILRILYLLVDNAIKYGDGTGIRIILSREDEGVSVIVRNKGELVPENELSLIFMSFRRGSNVGDKEGSGIGLYTASQRAAALGGTIFVRRLEESSEMEFTLYLPV